MLLECLNYIVFTRNEYSGNTGRLNRNLYVMLKFTELPKTPGMTSLKNIAVSQVHMMAEQKCKEIVCT